MRCEPSVISAKQTCLKKNKKKYLLIIIIEDSIIRWRRRTDAFEKKK